MAHEKDRARWRAMGAEFSWGALGVVGMICIIILVIELLRNIFGIGVDDCDRNAWHRCNMRVLTDAKTGQQYLVTTGGGITPRLQK